MLKRNLLQGFFQGCGHWQSHHVNAFLYQLNGFTLRRLTTNAARLGVAVVHGSRLIRKTITNVFCVSEHMAYCVQESGLQLRAGATLSRLIRQRA